MTAHTLVCIVVSIWAGVALCPRISNPTLRQQKVIRVLAEGPVAVGVVGVIGVLGG